MATNEYLTKTNDASANGTPWLLADAPPVRLTKCIAAILALETNQGQVTYDTGRLSFVARCNVSATRPLLRID